MKHIATTKPSGGKIWDTKFRSRFSYTATGNSIVDRCDICKRIGVVEWHGRVQMCPYVHYHSVDNWIVQSRERRRGQKLKLMSALIVAVVISLCPPGSVISRLSLVIESYNGIWLADSWDLQIFPPHLIVPGNLKNVQFRRPLPGLIKCLVSFPSCKLSLEFGLCEAFRGGNDFSQTDSTLDSRNWNNIRKSRYVLLRNICLLKDNLKPQIINTDMAHIVTYYLWPFLHRGTCARHVLMSTYNLNLVPLLRSNHLKRTRFIQSVTFGHAAHAWCHKFKI